MADTKQNSSTGTAIELDVLKGTLGQDVIDIRTLWFKRCVHLLTQVYFNSHPANLNYFY